MIQITIQLRRKKKKKNHNVSFARAVDFRQRLALWPDGRQQLRRELVLRCRQAAESFDYFHVVMAERRTSDIIWLGLCCKVLDIH